VATPDQRIILELHGSKAQRGVELDGLEGFFDHFRRALREFERASSARAHEVGRTGQPGSVSKAVTGFRLVHFETGSGIAHLEPLDAPQNGNRLVPGEPPSSGNLRSLLEAVAAGRPLTPRVIESLDGARRALGDQGRFGVKFAAQNAPPTLIGAEQIQRLEAAVALETEPKQITVSGKLHLIEVEQPGKVEIRAGDGVNWIGSYDATLKPTVLGLVDSVVRARGLGRRTAHNRGSLELLGVEPLPKFEQTPLFTRETVPIAELERQQGITRPQGLAALQDPEWEDDEASREYLSLVLNES